MQQKKKKLLEGKEKKSFPTHQEIYRAPDDEEDGKLAGTSDIPWERVARCTGSHGTQRYHAVRHIENAQSM